MNGGEMKRTNRTKYMYGTSKRRPNFECHKSLSSLYSESAKQKELAIKNMSNVSNNIPIYGGFSDYDNRDGGVFEKWANMVAPEPKEVIDLDNTVVIENGEIEVIETGNSEDLCEAQCSSSFSNTTNKECCANEEVKERDSTKEVNQNAENQNLTESEDIVFLGSIKVNKQTPTSMMPLVRNRSVLIEDDVGLNFLSSSNIKDGFSLYCLSRKLHNLRRTWENNTLMNTSEIYQDFSVCSYNILCQTTSERTFYLYNHLRNSPSYISWNTRSRKLFVELSEINSDIYGLQEVQHDHYSSIRELLCKKGYEGHYQRKISTMFKCDGCAIFYKKELFEELEYLPVEYFVKMNTTLDKEQIAQIVVLKCRRTKKIIIVGNTHLIFNTERGDIKLAQLMVFFANINEVYKNYNLALPSIIILGDYNIEPGSFIYNFIMKRRASMKDLYVRTMSGQSTRSSGSKCSIKNLLPPEANVGIDSKFTNKFTNISNMSDHVSHPFNFESAYKYKLVNGNSETRRVSTYHKDVACPDFIFYTSGDQNSKKGQGNLKLLRRYSIPQFKQIVNLCPWPNEFVPSDHIPLIAQFRLFKKD